MKCTHCLGTALGLLIVVSNANAQYAYISTSIGVSVVDTNDNQGTAFVTTGPGNYGVAVSAATNRVYVASQGYGVSVIDATSNSVTDVWPVRDLGAGVNMPTGIAVNPAGTRVYLVCLDYGMGGGPDSDAGTVSVIDTSTGQAIATIAIPGAAGGIAVSPNGDFVYATRGFSLGGGGNSLVVISTATNAVVATTSVGDGPIGVAVNPAGSLVYVADAGSNSVSVLNAATDSVSATIPVGIGAAGIAVDSSGSHVYVSNQGDNTVSVIDTATNSVTATLGVGLMPFGISVSPTGAYIYVVNKGNGTLSLEGSSTLSVVDTATNAVIVTNYLGTGAISLGNFVGNFSGAPVAPLSISAGGIVSSATYSSPVAPGSLASVFGTFPVAVTQASSLPLPTELAGFSIEFGDVQAPFLYVSPTQANIQVPWELSGEAQAGVTATFGAQSSSPQSANLASVAPGIFAVNSEGQGAIVNAVTGQLISPSNPAKPGSYISIYCTGLGPVTNQPPTGAPVAAGVLAETTVTPTVQIGGVPALVLFSGLAPSFVGLYQINAQVPAAVLSGNAVALTISMKGATSNTVTVAVQ